VGVGHGSILRYAVASTATDTSRSITGESRHRLQTLQPAYLPPASSPRVCPSGVADRANHWTVLASAVNDCQFDYSPLSDIHLVRWNASVAVGNRLRQTNFAAAEALVGTEAQSLTPSGLSNTFAATGFIVNCPVVSLDVDPSRQATRTLVSKTRHARHRDPRHRDVGRMECASSSSDRICMRGGHTSGGSSPWRSA
jgi:hypothetical protein